jgi:uncharacterized membrane protein SpoIIM required for sporulation
VAVTRKKGIEPELERLESLVGRASGRSLTRLSEQELFELLRLYRFAATRISLYETEKRSPQAIANVRNLTARAHALLAASERSSRESWLARLGHFYFQSVPTTIRSEWKLILAAFVLLYGAAAVSWWAVSRDLDTAWSLLDPNMVSTEIDQLQETAPGQDFRGNFTFGKDASAHTAGWIMANNMFVGVISFASALVPPVYMYVLLSNGMMVGTYTAVAGHYGQAGSISSIMWCHGTLELQAIVLAGAAGLVLVRAWIAPRAWSRRHALKLEASTAWRLLAAVFPMLFFAGLIEGFVSPHVAHPVRMAVAITSGVALVTWVTLGGRKVVRAP